MKGKLDYFPKSEFKNLPGWENLIPFMQVDEAKLRDDHYNLASGYSQLKMCAL